MNNDQLFSELKLLKAYKEDRVRIGELAVKNQLLSDLIKYCYPISEVSHQACWSLEQSYLLHEKMCYPFLDQISSLYEQPINSSGMRSLAKIAFICCKKFYSPRVYLIQDLLSTKNREQILEGCFRTLIEHEGKTANQAFATRALFELGKEFDWVHRELNIKIDQIMHQNPNSGYRAVAKEITEKIAKYQS